MAAGCTASHCTVVDGSFGCAFTEMEVTLLRDLVEWLEHRVCSFYSRFKMLKIPIFPSLVGITEAVAVRVGVPHLFHGIARIAEPWVSSVDAILGGLVLNIIRFIMRICGLEVDDNRSVVSITRSTAQLDRTIEKLENELVRVQTQLAIEKREKDDLNATVRRVLVMMTHENDALEAFCDDQASTHISSARNKFLEDEIAVVRQEAAALASANDELRRESATVGHLAPTSVSKHNLDAQGLVVTATSEASGSSISSTVPPAIAYLAEATYPSSKLPTDSRLTSSIPDFVSIKAVKARPGVHKRAVHQQAMRSKIETLEGVKA